MPANCLTGCWSCSIIALPYDGGEFGCCCVVACCGGMLLVTPGIAFVVVVAMVVVMVVGDVVVPSGLGGSANDCPFAF